MKRLIFGCGYVGFRVAKRWVEENHQIFAVTRSPKRGEELQKLGLHPLVADVTDPASLVALPAAETVLYAVGYDRNAGKPMDQVYVDGLRNVLAAIPPATGRIIYVSSTGVYGQIKGEVVDEDSPCHPVRQGGRACLEAENLLRRHPRGQNAVILRMGGIYGPGRIPRLRELQQGRPLPAAEQGFLNLIHVEDATETVLAAEARAASMVYNVTDGHPVVRGDYFRELARLANAPPPRFIAPPPDAPGAQRASSDKRVSNQKMLRELGVQLRYPSYREGLAAILTAK